MFFSPTPRTRSSRSRSVSGRPCSASDCTERCSSSARQARIVERARSTVSPGMLASSVASASATCSSEVYPRRNRSSTSSASMPGIVSMVSRATSSISWTLVSERISSRQPDSRAASRTFWPFLPMASESCSSGTTSSMMPFSSSITTLVTSAGWMALITKRTGSWSKGMMSIFSPRSSCTTAWTREPFMPTQAPTGSTSESRLATAILQRAPGSRAAASTRTMPS